MSDALITPCIEDPASKDVDDALDEVSELLKSWENRLTIDNLALAERYIKGELRILVDGRFTGRGLDDVKCRAVLQGIAAVLGAQGDGGRSQRRVIPGDGHKQFDGDVHVSGAHRNDRLVLVQSIKLVNHPEEFVPTLVWLQFPDEPVDQCADALYLSRSVGFKFFDRISDREPRPAPGLRPVRDDKLPSELIQSGPQVVDHVADDATQASRNRFPDFDPEDLVAGLRVIVGDDFVWAAAVKRNDLSFKITDVAFGPFNFDAYACKRAATWPALRLPIETAARRRK